MIRRSRKEQPRNSKKLGLQKETLRHLDAEELAQVNGGAGDGPRVTARCNGACG